MAESSPHSRQIGGLQVLRAFAALAVVVHHAMEESGAVARYYPDWLVTAGAAGVDVFFVISGFIMLITTFDLRSRPLSAADFLIKRLTRIYPLYWTCCAATLVLMGAGLLRHVRHDPLFVLRSLLLLPSSGYLIGVAWTLVYEMFFYVLFAMTLFKSSRDYSVALTSLAITAIVLIESQLPRAGQLHEFLRNPIMLEFCLGLGLAWLVSGRKPPSHSWPAAVAGLLICLAAAVFPHETTNGLAGTDRVVGWGVPGVLLVWSALRLRNVPGLLGGLGVRLGNASYAIYLTHPFVMLAYAFLLKHSRVSGLDQRTIVPLVVLVSAVLGLVTHEQLERRLSAMIGRALRRPVGVASPAEDTQPQ